MFPISAPWLTNSNHLANKWRLSSWQYRKIQATRISRSRHGDSKYAIDFSSLVAHANYSV